MSFKTMPCRNLLSVIDLRIYGEERTQNFTRYNGSSSLRCRIDRVYHHVNIANNTKINHIIISLTDRCTDISIDKLPLKTKTGKNSWYFSNSLLCKPDFFSATNDLFSLLITQKNKNSSTRTFLKISPLKKI